MSTRSQIIDIRYSDIDSGWDGEGNIDADPLFTDANSDDYTGRIAQVFADNGKPDTIRVSAVGGEDEKGSKVDIDVDYIRPDGSARRLRPISLKTSSPLVISVP